MNIAPKHIELFVTKTGKIPFTDWLESLRDPSARALIKIRLDRVRLGNLGDHKSVGKGAFELRVNVGPGYRIYYGQVGNRIVVLLCGGDKSSQAKDVKKAQGFWATYRNQSHAKK
jgi:putative addiction module killer protein